MHAVRARIYKNRNRRVRTGIRNVLGHFLHDQGIANDEANYLRGFTTRFFPHDRAMIQLHKQHQSCFAQAALNYTLQFGKRTCLVRQSPKFSHIRMTDGGVHTGYYFIERLGSRQTEPLYLDFFNHLEALYTQSGWSSRMKVTAAVGVEIRSSGRWRALRRWHCSVPHCAGRRRDSDLDSCRPWRLVS